MISTNALAWADDATGALWMTGSGVAQVKTSMSGVAGRYAAALFELASEAKAVDAVEGDLKRFRDLVAANPDMQRLVRSPVIVAEQRQAALGAVLDRAAIAGIAGNFVRLVAAKRRLFAIDDMIGAYEAKVAERKGIVPAEVTVAEAMPERLLGELKTLLAKAAGKDVSLAVKINPDIIGGMIVKFGHRMIDASLKTKLNALRVAMREVN